MSLLEKAFGKGSILLNQTAADWQGAVRLAGDGLVASGCTTAKYTDAMIATIEDLGPYVVIAPGLAMPHARPGDSVLHTGMSLVTLAEPVDFGSSNDPVKVIFALAARDHDKHLELLSEFAGKAAETEFVNSLLSCQTEAQIRTLIH
jgi:PTS system ascorbate-specific IIA component